MVGRTASATGHTGHGTTSDTSSWDTLREYMKSRAVFTSGIFSIVVDAFRYVKLYKKYLCDSTRDPAAAEQGEEATAQVLYFLSHFHSDHYTGLSSGWNQGIICCSTETAAMVREQLGVSEAFLLPMEMGRTYRGTVGVATPSASRAVLEPVDHPSEEEKGFESLIAVPEQFLVRMVSANHCPGAVMFIVYSPKFGYLLHTGDFRFNGSAASLRGALGGWEVVPSSLSYETFLEDDPYLRHVAGKVDTLFLDNTFCAPAFAFPTQREAIGGVIDVVGSRFLQGGGFMESPVSSSTPSAFHVAVLIGSYTLGKERMALEVQQAFYPAEVQKIEVEGSDTKPSMGHHPLPILVPPAKMKMLSQINFYAQHFASWDDGEATAVENENSSNGKRVLQPPQRGSVVVHNAHRECTYYLSIYLVPMTAVGYVHFRDAMDAKHSSRGRASSSLYPEATQPTGTSDSAAESPGKRNSSASEARHGLLEVDSGVFLNVAGFDHVVGVEPTGWTKKFKRSSVGEAGTRVCVPYSEHCSFNEMVDFVRFINPRRIVPTVDVAQYRKNESHFVEKAPRLVPRYGTVPLTRMFLSGEVAVPAVKRMKKEEEIRPQRAAHAAVSMVSVPTNPFGQRAADVSGNVTTAVDVSSHPLEPPPHQPPCGTQAQWSRSISRSVSSGSDCIFVSSKNAIRSSFVELFPRFGACAEGESRDAEEELYFLGLPLLVSSLCVLSLLLFSHSLNSDLDGFDLSSQAHLGLQVSVCMSSSPTVRWAALSKVEMFVGKRFHAPTRLRTAAPDIAAEWDYTKNPGHVFPDIVGVGHMEPVWWKCKECGVSYEMSVEKRVVRGHGCPSCLRAQKLRGNEKEETDLNLLDGERNPAFRNECDLFLLWRASGYCFRFLAWMSWSLWSFHESRPHTISEVMEKDASILRWLSFENLLCDMNVFYNFAILFIILRMDSFVVSKFPVAHSTFSFLALRLYVTAQAQFQSVQLCSSHAEPCVVDLPLGSQEFVIRYGDVRLLRSKRCRNNLFFAPFIPARNVLLLLPEGVDTETGCLAPTARSSLQRFLAALQETSAVHFQVEDSAACLSSGCLLLVLHCKEVEEALQVANTADDVAREGEESLWHSRLYVHAMLCEPLDETSWASPEGISNLLQNFYFYPTCPLCGDRLDRTLSGYPYPLICRCSDSGSHCSCVQTSSCKVCKIFFEAIAASRNAVRCCSCGRVEDPWVCLICGYIGCSRYQAMHAKEHYMEQRHCFSMNLLTQEVWDYESDQFVHRMALCFDGTTGNTSRIEYPDREQIPGQGLDTPDIYKVLEPVEKKCVSAKFDSKLSTSHTQYSIMIKNELDASRVRRPTPSFTWRTSMPVVPAMTRTLPLLQNVNKTKSSTVLDYERVKERQSAKEITAEGITAAAVAAQSGGSERELFLLPPVGPNDGLSAMIAVAPAPSRRLCPRVVFRLQLRPQMFSSYLHRYSQSFETSAVHFQVEDSAACLSSGCLLLVLHCKEVEEALQVANTADDVAREGEESLWHSRLYVHAMLCEPLDETSWASPEGISNLLQNFYFYPTCPLCGDRLDRTLSGYPYPLICRCSDSGSHCSCVQTSSCKVCKIFFEAIAASRNAVRCCSCGRVEDPWVCLICGYIGCSRYQAMHAKEHYMEQRHCFSMNLLTQEVWDYESDQFVHRMALCFDGTTGNTSRIEYPDREQIPGQGLDTPDIYKVLEPVEKKCVSAKFDSKLSTSHTQYSIMIKNELDASRVRLEADAILHMAYVDASRSCDDEDAAAAAKRQQDEKQREKKTVLDYERVKERQSSQAKEMATLQQKEASLQQQRDVAKEKLRRVVEANVTENMSLEKAIRETKETLAEIKANFSAAAAVASRVGPNDGLSAMIAVGPAPAPSRRRRGKGTK
eukprot:gene7366-5182_t